MQSTFFRAVCQMGIFIICAQTITHFRPNISYEKYFKLLVSVMILIQIFQPVSRIFGGGGNVDLDARVQQLEEQMELGKNQAAESAARSERILEKMTLLQVQELLLEEGETDGKAGEPEEKAGESEGKAGEKQEDGGTEEEVKTKQEEETEAKAEADKNISILPIEKIRVEQQEKQSEGLEGDPYEGDVGKVVQ